MICQNCNKEIPSGADFCNYCGSKIAKEVKKENYSHTVWGKIQWWIDIFETINLSKITGHWLFKTIVVIALLVATYFGFYGDAGNIKFTESDIYTIQYNVDTKEYYIVSELESYSLGLYIPKSADSVRYTGYKDGEAAEIIEYKPEECNIQVNKGEYSLMSIELIDNKKTKQTLWFSCK